MLNKSTFSIFQGFILIILLLEIPFALAVPKTALVIGNSDYSFSPLPNPVNDAKDMASSLRDLGFDVDEHTNLDRSSMRKAIREFGIKLKKGGVGLFFYAGHGIQYKGKNYLIPVNTDISSEDEVEDEGIDANSVLRKMESAGNDFNIVIMDACRNNPFARSFRSSEQGLARMEGPVGSIIAYSTSPGSTAADGTGKNGLYTSYLLKAMKEPGLAIEEVFKKVRNAVRAETKGKQIPWESSSLTGYFEFKERTKPPPTIKVAAIPPPPPPKLLSKFSHLQVSANVPGGKVFIDDVEKGVVAGNLVLNIQNLKSKEVKVRVEKKGYKSTEQKIKLQSSEWRLAYFELIPKIKNTLQVKKNSAKLKLNEQEPLVSKEQKPMISTAPSTPKKETKDKRNILSGVPKKSVESMSFNFGRRSTSVKIVDVDIFSKSTLIENNRDISKPKVKNNSSLFSTTPKK